MLNLPTSIEPNPLIDTFVEVSFDSNSQNPLYIPGLLYMICNKLGFELVGPKNEVFNQDFVDIKITFSPEQVYKSEKLGLKILIKNASILFNSLDGYQGWQKYFEGVQVVLNEVLSIDVLLPNKIGLKYVSKFNVPYWEIMQLPNVNLNSNFQTTHTSCQQLYTFRQNIKGSINATFYEEEQESLVEVEVASLLPYKKDDHIEIFISLNEQHNILKEIFFMALKEEYLLTLNPKYSNVK